jgi:hypothetical protein
VDLARSHHKRLKRNLLHLDRDSGSLPRGMVGGTPCRWGHLVVGLSLESCDSFSSVRYVLFIVLLHVDDTPCSV